MADESRNIEKLTKAAKATLLESIAEAAEDEGRAATLESLARAYASVAGTGPGRGEVED